MLLWTFCKRGVSAALAEGVKVWTVFPGRARLYTRICLQRASSLRLPSGAPTSVPGAAADILYDGCPCTVLNKPATGVDARFGHSLDGRAEARGRRAACWPPRCKVPCRGSRGWWIGALSRPLRWRIGSTIQRCVCGRGHQPCFITGAISAEGNIKVVVPVTGRTHQIRGQSVPGAGSGWRAYGTKWRAWSTYASGAPHWWRGIVYSLGSSGAHRHAPPPEDYVRAAGAASGRFAFDPSDTNVKGMRRRAGLNLHRIIIVRTAAPVPGCRWIGHLFICTACAHNLPRPGKGGVGRRWRRYILRSSVRAFHLITLRFIMSALIHIAELRSWRHAPPYWRLARRVLDAGAANICGRLPLWARRGPLYGRCAWAATSAR